MKLGLGTVQFGLSYGINNTKGKPDVNSAKSILKLAADRGIRLIDTAADYGNSEDVLGSILNRDSVFKIITKTSKNLDATLSVSQSLKRMNLQGLYGVLIHDFKQYKDKPELLKDLVLLQAQGIMSKIGFSLYLPEELDFLLDQNISFDLLQVPYNAFDQRFGKYFKTLKERGVEIHVRSAFLQGLVFRDPNSLPDFFRPIKGKLMELGQLSKDTGASIQSLCLNFVDDNKHIDTIIIGVDSAEDLESNISALTNNISVKSMDTLRNLSEENEHMILPYNWKL